MQATGWLGRVFTSPRFEDDRDGAVASLINAILWSIIIAIAAYQLFQLPAGLDAWRLAVVSTSVAGASAALVALHRRRIALAAWTTIALVFGLSCLSIVYSGQIDSPGTTTFVILIVMSAMTLDWRATATWTVASVGALSALAWAQGSGAIAPVAGRIPLGELWSVYVIHFVALGWLVGSSAFAFRGILGELGQRSRALRDMQARHAELLRQSPDVVVALDEAGVVVECSPAVEQLFGYPAELIVGRAFRELGVIDAETLEKNVVGFQTALAGADSGLAETRVRHRDGSYCWVESNPRVVQHEDGRTLLYVVIRDTTRRHEAEEQRALLERQLHEASRLQALGRMAGAVAHDFNNLLLVILANTELLEEGAAVDRDASLEEVRVAAEGAADLTSQLLAFAGRRVPERDRVDAAASVARIEGLLRRLLPPGVTLNIHCGDSVQPAGADPTELEQVVMNLVMNAQQAMPGGGAIELFVEDASIDEAEAAAHPGASPGAHVRIAVRDQGRGMDEETRSRVFEPFFTLRDGGTGLGLATVHGIVTRAGGHTRVTSAPGAGTTFEVFLPVAAGEDETAPQPDHALAPLPERPVALLVDDEARVRAVVARLLELHGFRVLSADSAEQALALSRAEPGRIDLLVADILMPGASGTRLARELARERADLKVLLMSGYAPEDLADGDLPRSGADFISKPFSSAELRRRVAEVLQGA